MSLESTSWTGLIENAEGLENETGFFLAILDGVPSLICATIEDDFILPLVDLFHNPVMPVALLDPATGKLLPSQYPPGILGKTFEVNTIDEMILLSEAIKGDVAIVKGIPGGASYRLMGDNYNNPEHWQQLLSRFQNWNEILNKPKKFPPTPHEHIGEYAPLVNGKIPADYLSAFPIGRRYIAQTLDQMTGITATPGDICRVKEKGTYILFGSPYNIDDWIRLIPPEGSVSSVQGQTEDVWLEASDIGAANEGHLHNSIQDVNENEIKFKHDEEADKLSIYMNNALSAALKFGAIHTQDGEFCKIIRRGNYLYWINPETGEELPFA